MNGLSKAAAEAFDRTCERDDELADYLADRSSLNSGTRNSRSEGEDDRLDWRLYRDGSLVATFEDVGLADFVFDHLLPHVSDDELLQLTTRTGHIARSRGDSQ